MAKREFLVGIPGSASIVSSKQQRNWQYPVGTVFAKTISADVLSSGHVERKRIETQLLHYNGLAWQPYTYAWNEQQSDAELVESEGESVLLSVPGRDAEVVTQSWRFHSRNECRACHSNQAGGAVAFTFSNLSVARFHSAEQSQLEQLVGLGVIDRPPPSNWNVKSMVDPGNSTASLELRARSYLAANCAHCHCRGGGGTVALDLSFENETDTIFAVDFPASQGSFGIADARVIAPGAPERSILYYRMATSGAGHMPKLWLRDNDRLGLNLMHDWIGAMPPTDAFNLDGKSRLGNKSSLALQRFHQLVNRSDKDQQRAEALKQLAASDDVTRGLFQRFLPEAERTQVLGEQVDPAAILAQTGDAVLGRSRFLNSETQQCRNCHRLAGQGQAIGPDLDGIGAKRTKPELLESLLDPSRKIESEYRSLAVLTADGQMRVGLKVAEDPSSVTLRTADGKNHVISRDDIEQSSFADTSLMPAGALAGLTLEEAADLLEFLISLR